MNTEELVQAASKYCYSIYAGVPGDSQRETVSVLHLLPQTAGTTLRASASERTEEETLNKSVKMPAGVSWPRYLRMLGASMLSMFAGAQLSIPETPPKPGELITELQGYKLRQEAAAAAIEEFKAQHKVD
ncbi:hypothetical protein F7725_023242 [Dissostichus mawsoni]|uniref:Uncharacterized protein n=1 Tax=Dissostichus mawsoni TaxID=36200 RepID=A0A7J5Z318_DISMA|nr:hypothetical protein F7725_023242 [Dissostichus mawsoni]